MLTLTAVSEPFLAALRSHQPPASVRFALHRAHRHAVAHNPCPGPSLGNDLPPWYTVYQQTQRWLNAAVYENLVRDLRMLLREIQGRRPQP